MSERLVWHAEPVARVLDALGTRPNGLTFAEAARRLERYGPNELEEAEKESWVGMVLHQLKNPLVAILIVAAVIALIAGKNVDAIVIGVVIVFNTLIGFMMEYRAEKALAALKSLAAPEAEVVREHETDGSIEIRVKTRELVPGDIILLHAGDRIPADARILEAFNLELDESMLTGESTPVAKSDGIVPADAPVAERENAVFAGSIINQGRGRAVVYATAMQTEMGKIATLIRETESAETPLQRRTAGLGRMLGLLAIGMSSLTIVVAYIQGQALIDVAMFGIAMAVSAIPEGLPAVMSITLAVGVNRMARRHAIIRRLQAVDTLGSATTICTDKTGTLTTNEMTVRRLYVDGRTIEIGGVGFQPEGEFTDNQQDVQVQAHDALELLLRATALCNDAHLRQRSGERETRWEISGDPTEGALVVAAAKAGLSKDDLDRRLPRVDEIPFTSASRYMTTFHDARDGQVEVHLKGAPETVLALCDRLWWHGKVVPLSDETREDILQRNTEMAADALRVLGAATLTVPHEELERVREDILAQRASLVFVGLAGMIDPPRPEAITSVRMCQRAGIHVVMITGDHKLTAEAVAREIGIGDGRSQAMTGAEMDGLDDAALDAIVLQTPVWARVDPAHKHRIVESLRRQGHIVAMTGDGVNDAPALKAAEIGVAMGITGTDVTKETADMVLTDDNFASIVSAVEEGRVVFENVRKVVKFLIATNVGEGITILSSLFIFVGRLIFTPVQVLWVNLVTDGILDVTLAMEPKEGDVMDQPPRPPQENIINEEVAINVLFVALFMAVGTLGLYGRTLDLADETKARTVGFTTMAMFQVFNSLNCKSRHQSIFRRGVRNNPYLLGAIIVSVSLQVAVTLVPFLQRALGTVPLTLLDWVLIVLVASSILWADEIRKLSRGIMIRRREARQQPTEAAAAPAGVAIL